MGDILDWAKREIEIACKRERGDKSEGEWDYGCACYESALKAFESLCSDNHSGYSIGITKSILNRLIDGKPLTPIEDTDDIWNKVCDRDGFTEFQCKRMSSLFKKVHADESVTYTDVGRYFCVNIDDHDDTYTSGIVTRLLDELYPIEMPYLPASNKFKVYCEEFLTDRKNGDFDTVGVIYLIKPDGEKVDVGRYFGEIGGDMIEITSEVYEERRKMANERIEKEENNV